MMDILGTLTQIAPSAVAVFFQKVHFPSERSVKRAADELSRIAEKNISKEATDIINGRLSIASLVPSFVSVVGAFFILQEHHERGIDVFYMFSIATLLSLFIVMSILSDLSAAELFDATNEFSFLSWTKITFRPRWLTDWFVYGTNGFLMAYIVILSVFFSPAGESEMHCARVSPSQICQVGIDVNLVSRTNVKHGAENLLDPAR
jgi:hypothetical protein